MEVTVNLASISVSRDGRTGCAELFGRIFAQVQKMMPVYQVDRVIWNLGEDDPVEAGRGEDGGYHVLRSLWAEQ
jgi:hypothetical protein